MDNLSFLVAAQPNRHGETAAEVLKVRVRLVCTEQYKSRIHQKVCAQPCYDSDKRGLRLRRKTRSASTNSQGSALPVQFLALFPTAKGRVLLYPPFRWWN